MDPASRRPAEPARYDSLIAPGERIGPVDSATSERALIERLGPSQVVRREVYLGEGICTNGTVVFPGTPDSLEVMWTDSTFTRPAAVRATGEGSRWRTPAGVGIGTRLAHLESLSAGRPVRFMGFDWDYGGSGSWSEPAGTIGILLHPERAAMDSLSGHPRFREILGDREVGSDHPLIRSMDVRVRRIFIHWSEPKVQFNCSGIGPPGG